MVESSGQVYESVVELLKGARKTGPMVGKPAGGCFCVNSNQSLERLACYRFVVVGVLVFSDELSA